MRLLSGSEIIHQKLNGPKELPASGWKEYCPSNSWLEQKQIQASLEDKCSTIGAERIEKQNNLARAEWVGEFKKAKVLKKIGKYWEVVGHHQDDEDWLLPEEALYLIEINVLELLLEGVPVSVQHAYALLLSEQNNCSLEEYRVYSYLSRRGYKLIRHAEEVTVTRYEKQINLDQILETQKRNVRGFTCEINSSQASNSSESLNETAESVDNEIPKLDTEKTLGNVEISTKRPLSDNEDIYIVEDNVEVVEIEDTPSRNSSVKGPVIKTVKQINSQVNSSKKLKTEKIRFPSESLVIVIDDDDGNSKDETKGSDVSDDVLSKSTLLKSREWYKPLNKALLPTEIDVVDLSEDVQVKSEKEKSDYGGKLFTASKSRNDILDKIVNAKNGVAFIKSPIPFFLPDGIKPKHAQYRVNLNKRQQPNNQQHRSYQTSFHAPQRQQQTYYNSNHFNNRTNLSLLNTPSHVLVQAYEMRTMAISMLRTAGRIMSAMRSSSCSRTSLTNNLSPSHYTSRPTYNPSMPTYNYSGTQGNSSNSRGRRNPKFRNYWNNNSRNVLAHNAKRGRYYKRNAPALKTREVVLIDSDEEEDEDEKSRSKGSNVGPPSKKLKSLKHIEVIDLCDDDPVKNERAGSSEILKTIHVNDLKAKNKFETDNKEKYQQDIEKIANNDEKTSQENKIELRNYANSNNSAEMSLSPSVNLDQENDHESERRSPEKVPNKSTTESPSSNPDSLLEETSKINEESNDSAMEVGVEPETNNSDKEPSSWQQYKEQTDQDEPPTLDESIPLVQPDHVKDIASLIKSLHIFETIDDIPDEGKKSKISFDAYSPSSPFKKTLKTLPKFRIIVVNSKDSLPSLADIHTLKSCYQDGISFLYAIVCDDSVAFYMYDSVLLPAML